MAMHERTGLRDRNFSAWVRSSLPPSSQGVLVSDLDWIIYNFKTKKLMLLEHKCRMGEPGKGQRSIFQVLHAALLAGIPSAYPEMEYLGLNLLQFPGEGFNSPDPETKDDHCFLNGRRLTEQELIRILSF